MQISVSWSKEKYTSIADAEGNWLISIKTPKASYDTHSITISEGKDKMTVNNILIGEVWLASGQSNMEMLLKGFAGCCVQNGTEDAMKAHIESPYVRMFKVKKTQSLHEQKYRRCYPVSVP